MRWKKQRNFTLALAHAVGLKAYFCNVERDYRGRPVVHACVGVFFSDALNSWFGVPHQEYAFNNDIEVIGIYLCQSKDISKMKMALKLVPKLPIAYFNLALELGERGQLEKAREELNAGLGLDSKSWLAHYTQGYLGQLEERWKDAVAHFKQCVCFQP